MFSKKKKEKKKKTSHRDVLMHLSLYGYLVLSEHLLGKPWKCVTSPGSVYVCEYVCLCMYECTCSCMKEKHGGQLFFFFIKECPVIVCFQPHECVVKPPCPPESIYRAGSLLAVSILSLAHCLGERWCKNQNHV